MTAHSPDAQAERLLQLSEEVSRIAGSLAQLSIGLAPASGGTKSAETSDDPKVSEELVGWAIRARRARGRYLSGELFADPAWDMLLDLLHAELGHRRVSVSSLCLASGVPPTTGLRWLKNLLDKGLVVRRADPLDARRSFVELAPHVSKALRRYFADVVQPRQLAGR